MTSVWRTYTFVYKHVELSPEAGHSQLIVTGELSGRVGAAAAQLT